jgi:putative inorganic carbon (hco3(-)) transporter
MGLVLVILYITLNLLSPAEIFPALAGARILLILTIATIPFTLVATVQSGVLRHVRTQFVLTLLLVMYIAVSWLPHGWLGGMAVSVDSILPNVMAYFAVLVYFGSVRRLQILRFALVGVAMFVLYNAFTQIPVVRSTGVEAPYVLGGLISTGSILVRIRGLGLLHDPNYLGQFLLLLLPLLFADTNFEKTGPARHFIAFPVSLLLLVGIYYTNSRGSQLGVALLLGLLVAKRFKRTGALFSGLIGFVMVIFINRFRERSVDITSGVDRLLLWSDGLSYFKSSPLWGIGYNGFIDRNAMTAHNSFLLVASELGMIGYFIWMGIIVVTVMLLRQVSEARAATDLPLARWAEAVKRSLYVYLFTSFFISRAYNLPLFLLLGAAGAIINAAQVDINGAPVEPQLTLNPKWPLWALSLCVASIVVIYILVRLRAV